MRITIHSVNLCAQSKGRKSAISGKLSVTPLTYASGEVGLALTCEDEIVRGTGEYVVLRNYSITPTRA
jgi:hypothetical protein